MNFISLKQTETRKYEEAFFTDANKILLLQKEVNELQEQLDKNMESIQKNEFQHNRVVAFEKLYSMKQISDILEPKREELKEAVSNLYYSLFPSDIFIVQYFFDVSISLSTNWLIRFSDDLESIEMMQDAPNPQEPL